MLEAIGNALLNFSHLQLWVVMAIGVVIGLVFGIIPGIQGSTALALLLPFVFGMKPEIAMPLMLAILATQFQGGAISAILINVPGTVPSACVCLDGFPMAQRGEAGRAIGAAEAASAAGGLLTVIFSLVLIPLAYPMVMAIGTREMVFVILAGIVFIAGLVSGSIVKGLLSGALGMMLALVGSQALTGVERFTFGSLYLYEGIPLIPLALGLFAVPEMVYLAARGGTIAQKGAVIQGMKDVWQGVLDVGRHWGIVLRSSIIAWVVGVIPGVGGETSTFFAYAQAKKSSKHPEKYGTGIIEGVIAPETATNGKEGGALLTTLALGIPGDSPDAFVLAGMIIMGIVPGPEMLTRHLDLSLTLFWVIFISGVLASAICLVIAPQLARLSFVPGRVLAPLILVVVFVGTFSYMQRVEDIIVLVITGAVALILRKYDYSLPALFLGFVLGGYFENYFFLALKTSGPLFFLTPINLTIILGIAAVFAYGPIKNAIKRRIGAKRA